MDVAREFLREWYALLPTTRHNPINLVYLYSAASSTRTLLVPDKDADGLSAGVILYRSLVALGHDASKITVHLLSRGSNPHTEAERKAMTAYGAEYAIFVDHGSRGGPELVPPGAKGRVKTLLVDHHLSEEFPEGATVCTSKY
jgi:single-stranded DNA-specific DHH superfamily exonuclease